MTNNPSEGTLIEGLRQSNLPNIPIYWVKSQSAFLQELACHTLSLAPIELGNATLESNSQDWNRQTHTSVMRQIMNNESASNLEKLATCINSGPLTLQQLNII